ncbi:AMP-binding protein [Emcibacter nanhaiensis]|uniref:AMP-binding protein n=1 Tax=Emcibacter nanhaiensis TaxID=1505037 RepID=A0A501PH45_9PROT|nr:AMP-binding protein [Emcibacter nanhaiensis]TPD59274.1 AMP-binding protein [Emcibacter nanhaiensis]
MTHIDTQPHIGKIILGETVRTLSEINHNATRAAQGLKQLGMGTGDVIALLLRNDFSLFEASFAANLLGALVVPINWHASADEVDYILRDSGARILVAHTDLYNRLEQPSLPGLDLLLVDTPEAIKQAFRIPDAIAKSSEQAFLWDQWLENFPPLQDHPQTSGGSMIYTSGTTGRPKGVRRPPLTKEQMPRAMAMACAMYGFQPDQPATTVITGPMYHSGPNGYGLLAARLNATIVLQPRFNETELLQLIEKHAVTHLHMVPTMFIRLLRLAKEIRMKYDLSSLVWVAHGAAPCPPGVKELMIDWWGPVINEYYGSTETGGITVQTSKDASRKPGSVGRAIEGVDIRIFDDNGQQQDAGITGKIYIRTNAFGDFDYHGKSQDRREISQGDFVWVGDIGYLDEEGFLYLCDRRKDIINSGGVNIYSAEVEAAILDMPGIEDCAVFGIPDDDLGEVVCSHITLIPSAKVTPDQVTDFVRTRLGRMKAPATVVVEDELPRQESGKIFKSKLRAPYWQDRTRNI